jgi:H2-forming N5,N10-methylenetetrahydromethanopterin dehydrogenase-like enzyme
VRLAAAGHDVVVKPPAIPADAEQVAAQVRAAGG